MDLQRQQEVVRPTQRQQLSTEVADVPDLPRRSVAGDAAAPRASLPTSRGVYLVEGAPGAVRTLGWIWLGLSLFYLVALVFISLFYFFAPPWDEDFRMLPPPGTGILWAAIGFAWLVNIFRVFASYALASGQRGTTPVKIGWTVMATTTAIQAMDLFVNVAERLRGQPGRFTPVAVGVMAILTLVVLLLPRTLQWVWLRGALHVPKLDYKGNFAIQQAEELGIEPPGSSRAGLTPNWEAARGTDFTTGQSGPTVDQRSGETTSVAGAPYQPTQDNDAIAGFDPAGGDSNEAPAPSEPRPADRRLPPIIPYEPT